jgi:hypothetical protein
MILINILEKIKIQNKSISIVIDHIIITFSVIVRKLESNLA